MKMRTAETILRSINSRTGACKPSILRCRVNFILSCVSSHCRPRINIVSEEKGKRRTDRFQTLPDAAVGLDFLGDTPHTILEGVVQAEAVSCVIVYRCGFELVCGYDFEGGVHG